MAAAAKKTPAKKAAPKKEKPKPGNDRVAMLAAKFKTAPGGTKPRTASEPSEASSAAAALIGIAPTPPSQPEPDVDTFFDDPAPNQTPEGASEPTESADDVGEATQPLDVAALRAEYDAAPEVAEVAVIEPEPPLIAGADEVEPEPSKDETPASPVTQGASDEPSAEESAPALDAAQEFQDRVDQFVRLLSGPEHSLDAQHDRIAKLTLELPVPLVDALNRWELDQVRRTGRRLYRERLVDMALAALPSDPDKVISQARDLPAWLKYADTEQVGTRVRASIALDLKVLKQEMKLRREKGTYVRHVYAAAIFDLLGEYGVAVINPER